ncbi:MAG TPA: DUF4232 domain-containing protein [Thermomicrobiaceae bacterium]|nr:DUF4232 domain-containing protein [Thermomicrobiaceae bacterium]
MRDFGRRARTGTTVRGAAACALLALALALLLPATALAAPAPSADPAPRLVYFPETGHYLAYGFLDYWLEHGQVALFGYPISEELTDPQSGLTVQYFERAVFEYHPDNPPEWRVEPRRLGALATASRQSEPPFQPVNAQSDDNCTYYPPTSHRLCFGFRAFWQQNGGLAIFGYPISEEFQEGGYTVQYFERARFEYHPDNPPAWQVELGLLGDQAAQQSGIATAPLAQSSGVPAYNLDLWSRCGVSQLAVMPGPSFAATGHILTRFVLQNTSPDTCFLYGYPGMLMLDAQGNPLPTQVHRSGAGSVFAILSVPPGLVFLPSGAQASFDVGYNHIPTGSQSCPTSAQLEITPPDDFDQLVVNAQLMACGGDLYVSPVVLGDQGVDAGG